MKKKLDYIKTALDVDKAYFGIADQKNGVWIAFPIREFNKKKNGETEITIIVSEKDIETINDINKWIEEMMSKFNEQTQDEKDRLFVAEAFGEVKENPLRLPNILMYSAEIMFQDTGSDVIELKSKNGVKFKIERIDLKDCNCCGNDKGKWLCDECGMIVCDEGKEEHLNDFPECKGVEWKNVG